MPLLGLVPREGNLHNITHSFCYRARFGLNPGICFVVPARVPDFDPIIDPYESDLSVQSSILPERRGEEDASLFIRRVGRGFGEQVAGKRSRIRFGESKSFQLPREALELGGGKDEEAFVQSPGYNNRRTEFLAPANGQRQSTLVVQRVSGMIGEHSFRKKRV